MKGCVTAFLLLLLLAMNGYAVWQVTRLRGEVAALRAAVAASAARGSESDADLAAAALRAVQHGQWERARDALEALSDRIEGTKALLSRPRRQVQRRLAEARRALEEKRQDAAAAVQALLDELSPHKESGQGHREDARWIGNSPLGQGV